MAGHDASLGGMGDAPLREIEITTQDLEAIVIRTHGLGPDAAPAISSRLRYLQRMSFPAGVTGGRGRRLAYGLEDALMILMVMRYLEWSLSPVRAMRTVTMNWPHLSRALAAAWLTTRDCQDRAPHPGLLTVTPTALGDIGEDPSRTDGQAPETVTPMTGAALADWASASEEDGDACQLLVIDPVRLVRRISRAIAVVCGAYPFEVEAAFERLGAAAFGTDEAADWRLS